MKQKQPLPAPIRNQLAAVTRRVYVLRLLRGGSCVVLTAALAFLVVFILDFLFHWPEEILRWFLLGMSTFVVFSTVLVLVLPLCRRVKWTGLAALVEKQHPELAERLTSSVHLAEDDNPHGTAEFITRLLQQTDEQTRSLVFLRVVSARFAFILAITALFMVSAAAAPAIVFPQQFADFSQRFFLSWLAPPALWFEVEPGDRVVALGQPLEFKAKLHRRRDSVALPETVWLVRTDPAGRQKRRQMAPVNQGSFNVLLQHVNGSFTYRIEAGAVRSESYCITAVQTVELDKNSPRMTITPPVYVNRDVFPKVRIPAGMSYITALHFSTIRFDFGFTRSAERVSMRVEQVQDPQFRGQKTRGAPAWTIPVALSAHDRAGANLALPMLPPGRYRMTLHMEAEHAIRTEAALPELDIRPDLPPVLVEAPSISRMATDGSITVHPNDSIPLLLQARDGVGLGAAGVEFRINEGKRTTETVSNLNGNLFVALDERFELRGKVKHGDQVLFRIWVSDNRQLHRGAYRDVSGAAVPKTELRPQTIFFPKETDGKANWIMLRVDKNVKPLEERAVTAERDDVHNRLEAARQKIISAREKLLDLEQPSRPQEDLKPLQMKKLDDLSKDNDKIKSDLNDVANKTEPNAELRDLGAKAQKIADEEIQRAGKALQDAGRNKAERDKRRQHFNSADKEWKKALEKIGQLQKDNETRFQKRLDAIKLKQLAQREKDLANNIGKLKNQDPNKTDIAKLQDEQNKIGEKLKNLSERNPELQAALSAAQAKQAAQLAKKAEQLAKEEEEISKEADKALQKQLADFLTMMIEKQQEIATEAGKLAKDTALDAKSYNLGPLKPQVAQDAVESLKQRRLYLALRQQTLSAAEMSRFAEILGVAVDIGRSPRRYVQRIAKRQYLVGRRLLTESAHIAGKSTLEILNTLRMTQKSQASIRLATQKVMEQFAKTHLKNAHQAVVKNSVRAEQALQKFDATLAYEEMQKTHTGLLSLAGTLPNASAGGIDTAKKEAESKRQAGELEDLAAKQIALRDLLEKYLKGNEIPPAPSKNNALTKTAEKQLELEKQTADFNKKMQQLAKATAHERPAQQSAKQAAKSGKQAQTAMKQSAKQGKQGNAGGAKKSAMKAANSLKQAAKQARKSAGQLAKAAAKTKPGSAKMQASANFQKGQQQAKQAAQKMAKGQMQKAQKAAQQSAQSLSDAARQMAKQTRRQSSNSRKPAISAVQSGVFKNPKEIGNIVGQFNNKNWGELSGELRTRLLMDARARYGAEYAAVIQRYFERISHTKEKQPRR